MPDRPALILGTAQLGLPYGVANHGGIPGAASAEAILDAAWQLGAAGVDTAPEYGAAEQRIGSFLRAHPETRDWTVCTKLPKLPSDLSPADVEAHVARALARSRRTLGRDPIDVYLVHGPDDLSTYGAVLVDALARRREAGEVRTVGASVYEPDEAARVLATLPLSAIQFPFNLFDRRMRTDPRLAALTEDRRCTMARSALLQGLFALDPGALPPRVEGAKPWLEALGKLAREAGIAPVPLALAYAAARSGARQLVLGVETGAQLHEASAALARPLDAELAKELDRAFADVPANICDPRVWTTP